MFCKVKEENLYLTLSLIVGLLLVFLIPPFNSSDEDSHFKKAYLVANGNFYPTVQDGTVGNYLPNNMVDLIELYKNYTSNYQEKYNYQKFITDLQTLGISDDTSFYGYSTAKINPVIYVVPASGILVSNVFSKIIGIKPTITNMLYGARLMSLLIYSLGIYFAIKISPKFKKSLLTFGLLPMTMSLISCVSYDALLIVATILLFGIVMNLRNANVKLEKWHLILLGIITFIYINLKYIYILNLLMLLLIPKDKIGKDKKDIIKKLVLTCLIVIAFAIITQYKLLMISPLEPSNLPSLQLKFVLNNPFKYLKIYLNTLLNNRFFYLSTFVGVFGLLDTYLPNLLYALYILMMFVILISDCNIKNDDKMAINWSFKLLTFLASFCMISLSFLAMYINWTSMLEGYGVGASTISGVQGRYFIPALIPIIIVFVNKFDFRGFAKLKKFVNNNYGYGFICYSLVMIITILLRFWM